MNKAEIRKEYILARKSVEDCSRSIWDNQIFRNFKKLFANNDWDDFVFYVYVSTQYEADTRAIINLLLENDCSVAVPLVNNNSKTMDFFYISSLDELHRGSFGIDEPESTQIAIEEGVMVMPGVAFDRNLNRVGYGGGYYDKYIKSHNHIFTKIALCYDMQVAECIPAEEHDISPDIIITQSELIW